jgi:hypothetical protein
MPQCSTGQLHKIQNMMSTSLASMAEEELPQLVE